jgi:protein SCO1/2
MATFYNSVAQGLPRKVSVRTWCALLRSAVLSWCVLALCVGAVSGQQPAQTALPAMPHNSSLPAAEDVAQKLAALRKFFPDVALRDQDDRRLHFYSDLIKNRVVVINFIYTTCTAVCPLQAQVFAQLHKLLGERVGRNVHLISITTDPLTDTPARLKAWGAKFNARQGWTLLTGEQVEVDKLLIALKGDAPGRGMHTPAIIIYNDDTGAWARANGLAPAEEVMTLIDRVSNVPAATERSKEPM